VEGALPLFKEEEAAFRRDLARLGTNRERQALDRIRTIYGEPFMEQVLKFQSGDPAAQNCVRYALTALTSLRFLRGSGAPDFGPIVSPFTGQGWDREKTKRLAVEFWKELRVPSEARIRKEVTWTRYHIPHGAGPNGPGALWTSFQDFVTL
jgi:hypothetical protein